MALIFHRLASKEAQSAIRWYRQRSPLAARRFVTALDEAVTRIEATPELWSVYGSDYRWTKLRRFPYLVYYEIRQSGDIRIMAVAHGSRRPGHWFRRKRSP